MFQALGQLNIAEGTEMVGGAVAGLNEQAMGGLESVSGLQEQAIGGLEGAAGLQE